MVLQKDYPIDYEGVDETNSNLLQLCLDCKYLDSFQIILPKLKQKNIDIHALFAHKNNKKEFLFKTLLDRKNEKIKKFALNFVDFPKEETPGANQPINE